MVKIRKLKNNRPQYHALIGGEEGKALYDQLIDLFINEIGEQKVKFGVYGNQQILTFESNGPFTHSFDI